ncbi:MULTISPECIES: hypothetical protein [Frankia]|uniref:hypothetical protein n=1 Tax=Frankia TaxID=1854 RepID=UPI0010416CA2|nr:MULTISPECIES: hypothetical protein [Frankia]
MAGSRARTRAGTRVPAGGGRQPRNPVLSAIQAAVLAAVLVVGVSLGRTLALPGDAGTMSRVADWGRVNHLSFLVDQFDRRR